MARNRRATGSLKAELCSRCQSLVLKAPCTSKDIVFNNFGFLALKDIVNSDTMGSVPYVLIFNKVILIVYKHTTFYCTTFNFRERKLDTQLN
jgi:hypothetical protein